jgi:hypothetical protein
MPFNALLQIHITPKELNYYPPESLSINKFGLLIFFPSLLIRCGKTTGVKYPMSSRGPPAFNGELMFPDEENYKNLDGNNPQKDVVSRLPSRIKRST